MQFNLCVKFVRGCHNYAADCLSRIFEDMTAEQKLEFAQDCDSKEEFIVAVDYSPESNQRIDEPEVASREACKSADMVCYRVFDDVSDSASRICCLAEQENRSELDSSTAGALDMLYDTNAVAPGTGVEEQEITPKECTNNQLGDEISQVTEDVQLLPVMHTVPHIQDPQGHSNNGWNVPITDSITATSHGADEVDDTNEPITDSISDPITPQDVDGNGNVQVQNNTDAVINLLDLPTIKAEDYLKDEEFKHMFQYLSTGDLVGNDDIVRLTLLMADQYYIDNDALYRLTSPRNKKQSRLRTHNVRLCVPLAYRHEVLRHFHDKFGHSGVQRLFLTLSERLYWKNLYTDLHDYVKTCDTCLRAKRNYAFKTTPLHPLEVPSGPCDFWQMDHKNLSRPTREGNVGILCIIDAFSGWPIIKGVPDFTALTSAKVFFKEVVAVFGIPRYIMTDKGPAFVGTFFKELAKLLGITHRSSSACAKRSNGLAESLVQRVSQALKYYSSNDRNIDHVLPIIEMSLRSAVHSRINISSYEVLFGRKMRLAMPGEPIKTPALPLNQLQYYELLKDELKTLHEGVRQNRYESKEEDKIKYDEKNAVAPPRWKIGDRVLVHDKRIKPHSDQVLTHRPYNLGPHFIVDVVKGQDDVGQAYRLVDCNTGKPYRRLVAADRLKMYTGDRIDFQARLPRLTQDDTGQDSAVKQQSHVTDNDVTDKTVSKQQDSIPSDCHPAIRIINERGRGKRKEFYVQFSDQSKHWCDFVTPALLEQYRIVQDKRRRRRARNRKKKV